MHIRQVLVKAELEKYQQYKDIYTALKKGKLCFCCRTRRFSFFTWSYTCQFCKRPVCSQCCKKMRLPSKPYSTLPIFSLGPSTLQRGESFMRPEKPSTSHHHSLRSRLTARSKSVDKSQEEFPKELMEDWSTMEVCVDCKKFISEIISSSRRSLSLANKRARLKRKTQSFYMSSAGTSEYCPSERTINEIWAACLLLCFRLHEVIIHERGHWNPIVIPLLRSTWLAWVCIRSREFLLQQVPETRSAVFGSVQGDRQRGSCSCWEKINSLESLPLLYVCVETRKPFLASSLFLTMLWIVSWEQVSDGEPDLAQCQC